MTTIGALKNEWSTSKASVVQNKKFKEDSKI